MQQLHFRTRPGHMPAWRPEQAVLPRIAFDGDHVSIKNVRDYVYRSTTDYTPGYRDEQYDLASVERVWYIVAPFTRDWRAMAHTFLSFGFDDGRFLSVSVESRRAAGEGFSPIRGLLRQYDVMYVLGTERDLIGLRAVTRNDPVCMYPVRTTRDNVRTAFSSMVHRAAGLAARPEFYNSITNNCTTNILRVVNEIAAPPIPYGIKILLPGYSDAVAYKHGLIDTDLPLDDARAHFEINARAQAAIGDPDFSTLIRA